MNGLALNKMADSFFENTVIKTRGSVPPSYSFKRVNIENCETKYDS